MANQDNQCSHLEVKDYAKDFNCSLAKIFELQGEMQSKVYGYNYKTMNMAEVVKFLLMNNHALQDEFHELLDAVGGIKDGIGSASWKPWKKDNSKTNLLKLRDLSPDDRKELVFELADMLCFFTNIALALNVTADELFNVFMAKIEENKARQQRGY